MHFYLSVDDPRAILCYKRNNNLVGGECALNCRGEYEEEDNSGLKYNIFTVFVTGFVKLGNETDPQSHLQLLCSIN